MIAASIIDVTALPGVVHAAGSPPVTSVSAPLFSDVLLQALKGGGQEASVTGNTGKTVRRPKVDEDSETAPAAIANLAASAPPPIVPLAPVATPVSLSTALPPGQPVPVAIPEQASSEAIAPQHGDTQLAVPVSVASSDTPAQATPVLPTLNLPPISAPNPKVDGANVASIPAVPAHTSVLSKVEHWLQDTVLSAVPSSILGLNPLPTLHAVANALIAPSVEAKQSLVPKGDSTAAAIPNPTPATPGNASTVPQAPTVAAPATTVSDPSVGSLALSTASATQMVPVFQANLAPPLSALSARLSPAGKPSIGGTAGTKEIFKGTTAPVMDYKQQPLAASGTASNDQSSNDHASGEQNQVGSSTPLPNATVVPANAAAGSIMSVDHTGAAPLSSPAPPAPLPPNAAVYSANTAAMHAPVTAPPTQPLPDINTARIIQNVGQSEMRVGMRSAEFGTISISTSTNRDVISAQISLDHSELARTLAVHLPEMQARLGGVQPMAVRIDVGQGTGQAHGSPGGMANNNSAGHSRDERPQRGNAMDAGPGGMGGEQRSFVTASAQPAGELRLNERLDITA